MPGMMILIRLVAGLLLIPLLWLGLMGPYLAAGRAAKRGFGLARDRARLIAAAFVASLCIVGWANADDVSKVRLAEHLEAARIATIPVDALPIAMSLGAEGKHLAVNLGGGVQLWTIASKKSSKRLARYGGGRTATIFASDNPCYAVSSVSRATVSLAILDCAASRLAVATIRGNDFERLAVSPPCSVAIAQSSDGISTFDFEISTRRFVATAAGLAFPKNIDMVASGVIDHRCVAYGAMSSPDSKKPAVIYAVDLKTPARAQEAVSLGVTANMSAPWFEPYGPLAVSPNGHLLATSSFRNVRPMHDLTAPWNSVEIVDTQTHAVVRTLRMRDQSTEVKLIAFLSDEQLIFDTGRETFLLESILGQPQPIHFEESEAFQSPVLIETAPAAHILAVSGLSEIRIYDYSLNVPATAN